MQPWSGLHCDEFQKREIQGEMENTEGRKQKKRYWNLSGRGMADGEGTPRGAEQIGERKDRAEFLILLPCTNEGEQKRELFINVLLPQLFSKRFQ